ncbi:MAG: pentapeptide repeat-containing protein [Planctomycetes bacterium]|nr:pentapeptide repeat-containing protein [Planctomycetota bacterium]
MKSESKPITNEQEYYGQKFQNIHLELGGIAKSKFTDCTFVRCAFGSVALSNCRFTNCTFQECDLSLAQLFGSSFPSTVFENSKIIGIDWTQSNWSNIGLSHLSGFFDCILSHSTFIGLDLKGIQMKNCIANEVDFRDTNLSKANFQGTDLARSLFGNTNLTEADLSQARNYDIDAHNNIVKQAKFSLPEAMALLYRMDIVMKEQDDSVG